MSTRDEILWARHAWREAKSWEHARERSQRSDWPATAGRDDFRKLVVAAEDQAIDEVPKQYQCGRRDAAQGKIPASTDALYRAGYADEILESLGIAP